MRRSLRLLAALALVPLLSVSACGDKSDKEKFADEVNAICRDLETDLESMRSASTLEAVGREGKRLIPAVDRATQRLAKAKASKEVRRELGDEYLRFVTTFRAQAIAYGAIVGAAEENDPRSLRKLLRQLDELDRVNDGRARKLGFDDCAGD